MLLEDRVKEVSNRSKTKDYAEEIKRAVQGVSAPDYQDDQPLLEEQLTDQYLPPEETSTTDYDHLFEYLESSGPTTTAQEYQSAQQEAEQEDQPSEVMDNEQAEEMVQKYMVAALFGDKESISYEKNESFKWWLTFNSELRELYMKHSPIQTSEVNLGQRY